jgi:hypothetical protein
VVAEDELGALSPPTTTRSILLFLAIAPLAHVAAQIYGQQWPVVNFSLPISLDDDMALNRLHLASYNLRFDSMPDGISVADSIAALPDPLEGPKYLRKTGEQPWSTRRMRVAHKILSRDVDILCTYAVDQEHVIVISLTSVLRRSRGSHTPAS